MASPPVSYYGSLVCRSRPTTTGAPAARTPLSATSTTPCSSNRS
ncbi:hypothetical protein Ae706Ps2_6707c [Pseudonocardia sp. Ae706_Ps2]|nr:hypothetical protein Ae706Ps2_6707c [Pseudonocardia sp. Ae706_Ps2]